jgi:hypothetical protein
MALVTAGTIAVVLNGREQERSVVTSQPGTACQPVRELPVDGQEGSAHRQGDIAYESSPPHSGPHNPIPLQSGAHVTDRRTAPENVAERAVHNLEHAYVVVWYTPGASPDEVARAVAAADETGLRKVLVVPWREAFDDTAARFVLASWGYLQTCDYVPEAAAIKAFYDAHAGENGRAPEKFAP